MDSAFDYIDNEHSYSKGEKRPCIKTLNSHECVGNQPEQSRLLSQVHCSDSDCEILSSNDEEEEDEEIEEKDVLGGRRIVELSVLAAKLEAGCKNCSAELKLSSCIGEIRYGLGSLLKISCSQCQETNNIPTGKRHGTNVWDINTQLGAAALFCGQGEMIINNFLAALNIPIVTRYF